MSNVKIVKILAYLVFLPYLYTMDNLLTPHESYKKFLIAQAFMSQPYGFIYGLDYKDVWDISDKLLVEFSGSDESWENALSYRLVEDWMNGIPVKKLKELTNM